MGFRGALMLAVALAMPLSAWTLSPALSQVSQSSADWCDRPESSVWIAQDVDQGDIARMTVQVRCVLAAPRSMRAKIETRCGRALCSWGWSSDAAVMNEGIAFVFQTFAAERTASIVLNDGSAILTVRNDFRSEGRADEILETELVPEL